LAGPINPATYKDIIVIKKLELKEVQDSVSPKNLAKKHMQQKNWQKVGPDKFECSTCGKYAKTSYNIKVHIRSHMGPKRKSTWIQHDWHVSFC
jgi:hypothetical protein